MNHYAILGMNGTGLDSNGSSYTLSHIKRAYRLQALKYHPDKNQHPDAPQHYENIQRSHEVLTDPEKRADFDRELKDNPAMFAPQENLIIELDEDDLNLDDLQFDENPEVISVRLTKGINLTQLMKNANYSTASILHLARNNPEFSKAIAENSSVLAMLSIQQNFELIFILHFHHKNSPYPMGRVENKNETFLLGSLMSGSSNYDEYSKAFISVCLREKELATLFFETQADILEHLTAHHLLILSQGIHEAVYPLIRHHGANLRLLDVQFILQKHPAHKMAIIACGEASGLGSIFSNLDLGESFVNMVLENKPLDRQLIKQAIDSLGIEALQLGTAAFLQDDTDRLMFFYLFLDGFSHRDDAVLAIKKLNEDEKGQVFKAFVCIISSYNSGPTENKIPIVRLLNNIEFFSELLRFLRADDFDYFSRSLPTFDDKNLCDRYNDILLACKEYNVGSAQDSKLCLINLLTDTFPTASLSDNVDLLIAMLKKEEYVNELSVNPVFCKRVALWAAKSKRPLDEMTDLPLPSQFTRCYNAFTMFYQADIGHDGHACSIKMPNEVFHTLFNETGYFPDMSLIETDDMDIKLLVLNSASVYLDEIEKMSFDQRYQLRRWFLDVCCDGSRLQFEHVLTVYQEKCPQFILGELNSTTSFSHFSHANALILFNRLEENKYWNKRYITGAMINKWLVYLNQPTFVEDILKSHACGVEGASWSERQGITRLVKKLTIDNDIQIQNAIFSEVLNEYKSNLQVNYPRCSLGGYLTLMESPVYQRKAAAYRSLVTRLTEIELREPHQINTNEDLVELLDHLFVCGVDLDTLTIICKSLEAETHQPLRAALIAIVMESPNKFWLSEELSKYVSNFAVSDKAISELAIQFQALAEMYIHKHNKRIHGDILQTLYVAHGEKIMPTIVQYGLNARLLNGTQIEKTMSSMKSKTSVVFKNAVISTEETIAVLVGKLHNFVVQGLFNAERTSINQAILAEFHAEVQTFILDNEITHPILNVILNVYHRLEPGTAWQTVLMTWLFELTVRTDDFFKHEVTELLNNDATVVFAINGLADYLMTINQFALSFSDMTTMFGQTSADQVIKRYLTRIYPSLNSSDLEFGYIRTLLLTNKLSLVVLNNLTADQLTKVRKQGAYLACAVHTKTITIDHDLFSFDLDEVDLFPLFDNGLMSAQAIHELTSYPMTKLLYTSICQLCSTTNDVDLFITRASKMNAFCSDHFFNFLKSDISAPIEAEIDRLTINDGIQKAALMSQYKSDIEASICSVVSAGFEQGHDINRINRDIHTTLREKISTIIADPALNAFRDPIKAFFKALLGVLLAVSCAFIPFAFAGYRNYFFNSTSVYNMKNRAVSIESHEIKP